jgi:hypothetical protein
MFVRGLELAVQEVVEGAVTGDQVEEEVVVFFLESRQKRMNLRTSLLEV